MASRIFCQQYVQDITKEKEELLKLPDSSCKYTVYSDGKCIKHTEELGEGAFGKAFSSADEKETDYVVKDSIFLKCKTCGKNNHSYVSKLFKLHNNEVNSIRTFAKFNHVFPHNIIKIYKPDDCIKYENSKENTTDIKKDDIKKTGIKKDDIKISSTSSGDKIKSLKLNINPSENKNKGLGLKISINPDGDKDLKTNLCGESEDSKTNENLIPNPSRVIVMERVNNPFKFGKLDKPEEPSKLFEEIQEQDYKKILDDIVIQLSYVLLFINMNKVYHNDISFDNILISKMENPIKIEYKGIEYNGKQLCMILENVKYVVKLIDYSLAIQEDDIIRPYDLIYSFIIIMHFVNEKIRLSDCNLFEARKKLKEITEEDPTKNQNSTYKDQIETYSLVKDEAQNKIQIEDKNNKYWKSLSEECLEKYYNVFVSLYRDDIRNITSMLEEKEKFTVNDAYTINLAYYASDQSKEETKQKVINNEYNNIIEKFLLVHPHTLEDFNETTKKELTDSLKGWEFEKKELVNEKTDLRCKESHKQTQGSETIVGGNSKYSKYNEYINNKRNYLQLTK
jgi:hypothetical protein